MQTLNNNTKGPAGRTALITGGAKRLGRATALKLAACNVNVVIHYHRSSAEADALVAELLQRDVRAWAISANLGESAEVETLMNRAVACAGPIDILINNASIFPENRLATCAAEEVYASLNVNALAPLILARRFAAQHRPGVIINFLDARMTDYDADHFAYHVSKRMLHDLTRMMALEFAPSIRVNAVAPGLILPPPGRDESYLKTLAHTNPLNRYGAPEDITSAVLFLVQSEFITGQVLFVDGGRNMMGNIYG